MLPIGPLMTEHRLIERMVCLMEKELERIKNGEGPDSGFIDEAVDFFRIYADRTHHGKEEDILFRELAKKKIQPGHDKTMQKLINDHVQGRQMVKGLFEANNEYAEKKDKKSLEQIKGHMEALAGFYPRHIKTEDTEFFKPVMEYFSDEEKENMLKESNEFDRKMIHEKYKSVVEKEEKGEKCRPEK